MARALLLHWLLLAGFRPSAHAPNIVIILSDDMGFSDLGCYGGEIATPNLDALAAAGLRFTQFYNAARCCPTRASLLTGLYPHQAGVGWMTHDRGLDGYRGELSRDAVTIPEVLRAAGYRSYMAGKWHVSRNMAPDGPKHGWPLQRGFDRFYGTMDGAGNFFDPGRLVRDNTMISPFADPEYKPESYYYTDALSDHAVRYIADHRRDHADKPFLLYVAYTAAHWPLHAPEKDVAKVRGRYDAGYEPIRQARLERARRLGLIDPKTELTPGFGDWGKVKNKEWEARCMEVYAAMVEVMDRGIGRIVEALRSQGQLDNTLIFYLQDNGGCQETTGRTGSQARAEKATLPPLPSDTVLLDARPKQTRDGYPVLTGPAVMPGPADTYIGYGEAWANVSNTPFRLYKHFAHEGGISTPLIAHWPDRIKRKGELERQPGHLIDLMASCVDVSGAAYPRRHDGQEIKPMEGRSLVPAFEGRPVQREALYWEHTGNRAVRVGDFKLVARGPSGPWELYDLATDRVEMNDLAAREPERVKDLKGRWEEWARRAGVLPWIWKPAYESGR